MTSALAIPPGTRAGGGATITGEHGPAAQTPLADRVTSADLPVETTPDVRPMPSGGLSVPWGQEGFAHG